jgi:hypothetical protein
MIPYSKHLVFHVRPKLPRLGQAEQSANEAILALVDFPKQIVQALSTAVNHMKGLSLISIVLITRFRIGECIQESLNVHQGR